MSIEKYVDECVKAFQRFCKTSRDLIHYDINRDDAMEAAKKAFNGKEIILEGEWELKRYYENRNVVALTMLDSINNMSEIS